MVLAAYNKEILIGTVTLLYPNHPKIRTWLPDHADLRYMGVANEYKKKGVSKLLLKEAIQKAQGKKLLGITLHARREAIGVARLYESFGFARDPKGDFNPAPNLFLDGYHLKLGH